MFAKSMLWCARGFLMASLMLVVAFAFAGTTVAQGPTPTTGQGKGMVTKPKPPAEAKSVADTPEWDKVAEEVAKSAGFKNYVYEAWELPASIKWEDTFKYYNDQLKAAGWTGEGQVQDFKDGTKGGGWVDATTNTGVIVVFTPSPDGVKPAYDFAIFGITTPVPKAMADWTPLPTTDLEKGAAELAKTLGFTDYVVEAFAVPGSTKWDDVFKYYSAQMTQAGWVGEGVEQQLDKETKYGVYFDASSKSGLVVMQVTVESTTSVLVAVFGWTTSTSPAAPTTTTVPAAPTATSSSSSSAASTSSAASSAPAGPALSPAATDQYPLPAGKAGWVVKSFIGDELNYNINNKLYKILANGEVFIVLDPGNYNFSVNIPGKGEATGTVELKANELSGQTWTAE